MNNKSIIKIHPIESSDTQLEHNETGQLALDVYKTPKEIVIVAPIAGVNKDDITLTITEDVLVIRGKRNTETKITEENYYTKECFWGPFVRSIVLPPEADPKGISATFEKCILEIRIPRIEKEKTQIIKIKTDRE